MSDRVKSVTLKAAATAIALVFSLPANGLAQGKMDHAGDYRDWGTYEGRHSNGARECFMRSMPQSMTPGNVNHGDVYVTISHYPALKRRNEVSVVVGFSFQKNSEVLINAGTGNFRMFTEGDGAWLRTPEEDATLVDAMKRGNTLVVRGTSGRGTNVTYRFSLNGFTAAYNAISRTCGM